MDYIGFIYLWKNKINNKKYIGSHIGKVDDGYIGSGTYFKNAIKKYGLCNFERQILWFEFNNVQFLHQKEFEIINEYNAVHDENYYNQVNITPNQTYYIDGNYQYSNNFTSKNKKYFNNGNIEKRFIPGTQPENWISGRLKGKVPDSGKGLKWYNNGIIDKRFKLDEEPIGWVKGRIKGKMFGDKNGFYGKKHSQITINKIKETIRRRKCELLEKQ